MLDQGWATNSEVKWYPGSSLCHLSDLPHLWASVPSPHLSAPLVHRSLACWLGPQSDCSRTWRSSSLAQGAYWPRWLILPYPPNTRNGLPPVSLFENH